MLEISTQQAVLDAIPAASAIVDEQGAILAVNRAWVRFAEENGGDARRHYVGENYLKVCCTARGESGALASTVATGMRGVLAGEPEFRCEYACHSPVERRWFEVAISPLNLPGRRLALVMHYDITRRRREKEDAGASHEHLHLLADLVASSTDAIISYDMDGIIQTWNPAATGLYGYQPEEIIGRSMEVLYPDGWPMRVAEYRNLIIAGTMRQFELARRTKSGELREVAISAAPIRGADGEVIAILSIHRDITEAKANREHLAVVTRELGHRVKNLLTIVLAVERQTARAATSLEDFHERFSARLKALGASIELLAARNWGRIPLLELARRQLAVFTELDRNGLEIGGSPVTLGTEAVEALGMSLHELSTNALKYGALSSAGGSIRLCWRIDRSGRDPVLVIRWEESSPAIKGAPEKPGFGHSVITRIPEQKLDAQVDVEFRPGRLVWQCVLPDSHYS